MMEFFYGMASTMIFFSFCVWAVNRKAPKSHAEFMAHWEKAHTQARIKNSHLDRIATALENRQGRNV